MAWSRVLVVAWIAALAVAGFAAADDAEAELAEAFNRAYQAGDWQAALAAGLQLEAVAPDRPVHRYNLACVAALADDRDQAVLWLRRAAESGFWRLPLLDRDRDLDPVRSHPGFPEAAAAVSANYEAFRAAVVGRFAATPPLLLLPPDHETDRPIPIVIALHGFGGRADGYPMLWSRAAARAGAALVIPQAVRQAGRGYSWEDPDEADLIVKLSLDWVRKRLAVDEHRIVLTGFSQGGFVAMVLGARHPDTFAGVVPMAGGYRPEADAPAPAAGGRIPRYYFMVGSLDRSMEAVRTAADAFRDAGYPVRMRVLPGTGHTFPRDTDRELGKALRFALGDSSEPTRPTSIR